jgi:hypothetical protein
MQERVGRLCGEDSVAGFMVKLGLQDEDQDDDKGCPGRRLFSQVQLSVTF